MKFLLKLSGWHAGFGRLLDKLQPLALLAARLYVADVFIKSGWLKVGSWDQTVELFTSEYQVPLLAPQPAALLGTFGELFFPALLVVGLFGRIGALGTFAVNAVAVISYSHVLLQDGFEAAIGQHVLWGVLTLGLMLFGPGSLSLDTWLEKRAAARSRNLSPALT